jgi:hypothetical protein
LAVVTIEYGRMFFLLALPDFMERIRCGLKSQKAGKSNRGHIQESSFCYLYLPWPGSRIAPL